jgi:hypothetical protein
VTAVTCTWDWWCRHGTPAGSVRLMTWPPCEWANDNPPGLVVSLPGGLRATFRPVGGDAAAEFRHWLLSCFAELWPGVEFLLPSVFIAGWTSPKGTDGAYTPEVLA